MREEAKEDAAGFIAAEVGFEPDMLTWIASPHLLCRDVWTVTEGRRRPVLQVMRSKDDFYLEGFT